jgi:hypothetical protein
LAATLDLLRNFEAAALMERQNASKNGFTQNKTGRADPARPVNSGYRRRCVYRITVRWPT